MAHIFQTETKQSYTLLKLHQNAHKYYIEFLRKIWELKLDFLNSYIYIKIL